MENYDVQDKIRKILIRAEVFIIMGILVMELLMCAVFWVAGENIMRPIPYLIKYFLFPLVFNLAVLLVGMWLAESSAISWKLRNYIPLICMSLTCANMSYVYRPFVVTMSFACTIIIISGVFGSTAIARNMTWLNIILLVASQVIPDLSGGTREKFAYFNMVIVISFFIIANIFTRIIILSRKEQAQVLREVHSRMGSLEQKLQTDQMTGLYNHTAFYDFLETDFNRCQMSLKPLTLAIIDIDDFKKINDRYGHGEGDIVLISLAKILSSVCGEYGTVCRYGGEEFAVIFSECDDRRALELMEWARLEFSGMKYPFILTKQKITFSCGIQQTLKDMDHSQELFELADQEMYRAKRMGKNRCVIGKRGKIKYDKGMGELDLQLKDDIERIANQYDMSHKNQ